MSYGHGAISPAVSSNIVIPSGKILFVLVSEQGMRTPSLPSLLLLGLRLLDRQRFEARRVTFDASADLAHVDETLCTLHNGFECSQCEYF